MPWSQSRAILDLVVDRAAQVKKGSEAEVWSGWTYVVDWAVSARICFGDASAYTRKSAGVLQDCYKPADHRSMYR